LIEQSSHWTLPVETLRRARPGKVDPAILEPEVLEPRHDQRAVGLSEPLQELRQESFAIPGIATQSTGECPDGGGALLSGTRRGGAGEQLVVDTVIDVVPG